MPVSEEHYRKAVHAVKGGSAPDEMLDGLMDIIDEYERENVQKSPVSASSPTNYGEGGSMLGPTGMDMLEKQIIPKFSPEETKRENEAQRKKAREQNPKVFDALNLSASNPLPVIPDETPEEANRAFLKWEDEHFDKSAKYSASGRRDLLVPAEHIPEAPPNTAFGGVDPLSMFSGAIDKARSNLPEFAGGKVEHYLEPPVSQFRRDMAPVLGAQGIDVNMLDVNSRPYKEYSDMRWKEIYDQAKAEGRAVVRSAYKEAKTVGEKVEKYAAPAIGAAASAALGADEAAFGGMGRRLATMGNEKRAENFARLKEGNPIASVAGNIIGGASPLGMGGLASKAIGGTGLVRGAARGAAQGMGDMTSLALSEGRLPTGGELFLGAGLGAPFGAAAGVHGKHLRQTTKLGQIEESGLGETEMLRGIRRSSRASEIQEKATEKLGPQREKDYLIGELEEPMTTAARDLSATTQADIGKPQRQYYDMSKDVKKPQTPLLKEAMKIHAGGSYEAGGNLPRHATQNKELQELIASASHAEIVPAPSGKPTTKATNAASFDLTRDEAIAQGIDVDRLMKSHMGESEVGMLSGGPPNPSAPGELAPMWGPTGVKKGAPGEFVVRVTPKDLNPEQTENIIKLLHEQIQEGKNAGMLDSLHRASREVRDQFPAMGPIDKNASHTLELGGGERLELKGWSAWQHQAAEKTQKSRRVTETAGFQGKTPEKLGAQGADTLFGKMNAYRQPGRRPDADEALRELAGLSGKGRELEEVAGQQALSEIKGSIPTSRAGLLNAGRLRLDPLLQFYGPAFGAQAPGVSDKLSGRQKLPDTLDPETLRKLREQLGPFFGPQY